MTFSEARVGLAASGALSVGWLEEWRPVHVGHLVKTVEVYQSAVS